MCFIAVRAWLDVRYDVRERQPLAEFSWEGVDEGATLRAGLGRSRTPGRIAGRVFFHEGDKSGFVAVLVRLAILLQAMAVTAARCLALMMSVADRAGSPRPSARRPLRKLAIVSLVAAQPADPTAVAAFEALAFPAGQDEANRDGPRTNGLVVVRDGRLVYERYARGFGPDTPHIIWSASKSVLQAVYGAAVAEGLVDLDRPVAERSPWIGGGDKARITYRELLQMRSGIDFDEAYEFAPLFSSVLAMLYTRGRADMAAFAAAQPMAAEAGTVWRYKSGDSLILAAALRDLVGADRYPDYPWTALFDRIGVTSAVWERDAPAPSSAPPTSTSRPATSPASACSTCATAAGAAPASCPRAGSPSPARPARRSTAPASTAPTGG